MEVSALFFYLFCSTNTLRDTMGEMTSNITCYVRVSKSTWRQAALLRWQEIRVHMERKRCGLLVCGAGCSMPTS